MTTISVLDAVKMDHFGARVKDADNKLIALHKQQGFLDGACAVYSTIMDLLILGYLSNEDLKIYNPIDSRTSKGKFLQQLLEDRGLVREGFSYTVLARLLKESCADLDIQHKKPETEKCAEMIAGYIDDDTPVIISVTHRDGAHALVTIGYEYDSDDVITKLLCMDPAYPASRVSAWNCFIEIPKTGRKCYLCGTDGNYECKLSDLIVVRKK